MEKARCTCSSCDSCEPLGVHVLERQLSHRTYNVSPAATVTLNSPQWRLKSTRQGSTHKT